MVYGIYLNAGVGEREKGWREPDKMLMLGVVRKNLIRV